jgi:hypothetical protein
MVASQYDSLRQEVKFLIPTHAEAELKNILALEGWFELFPKRKIHSIYFDTSMDDFLFDSIYGISDRLKYRARWYNDDNYFVIECKRKSAGAGNKMVSTPVYFTSDVPTKKQLESSLFEFSGQILFQRSLISYSREYYYHAATKSKLTLDFELSSLSFDKHIERQIKSFFILEVKSELGASFSVPFGQFQSRFSKYCFSRVGDDSFY